MRYANENGLSGNNSTLQATSASRNEVKVICTSNFLGREINVYGSAENPLFKAMDVAEWIEYDLTSVNKLVNLVDDDEKVRKNVPTLGGVQEVWMLTEDGLYEVLMQSRKPIAKQFKKGVKEILKSIRKTGSYSVEKPLLPQTYLEALKALVKSEEEKQQLTIENENMKPKAEYFDKFQERGQLTNFTTAAKQLNIKRTKLIDLLLVHNYIYRDRKGNLLPYAQYVPVYFEIKDFVNGEHTGTQTLITAVGKEKFNQIFGGYCDEN